MAPGLPRESPELYLLASLRGEKLWACPGVLYSLLPIDVVLKLLDDELLIRNDRLDQITD